MTDKSTRDAGERREYQAGMAHGAAVADREGFGAPTVAPPRGTSRDYASGWRKGSAAVRDRLARQWNERTREHFTPDQVTAVMLAVSREVSTHGYWRECADMDLAELCAANQDALIDQAYDYPEDNTADLHDLVRIYDAMLGTSRARDLPEIPT